MLPRVEHYAYMNAQQFYEAYDIGWASVPMPIELKRLAGKTIKWKVLCPSGSLIFAIATNPKTAGLLPHLPGEYFFRVTWNHSDENGKKADEVSWFQYATREESAAYAQLQRQTLEKFLRQPGKEGLRSIYNYASDPTWLPRANFSEEIYYFDVEDAEEWGRWWAQSLPAWLERFNAQPESLNDWCWRVLWSGASEI